MHRFSSHSPTDDDPVTLVGAGPNISIACVCLTNPA